MQHFNAHLLILFCYLVVFTIITVLIGLDMSGESSNNTKAAFVLSLVGGLSTLFSYFPVLRIHHVPFIKNQQNMSKSTSQIRPN